MPVLLGTGGGPAWTPRVINALLGIAGGESGEFDGVAELRADALNRAAPIAADEAAMTDRLETALNTGVASSWPACCIASG
jgi:hypothetical protein